MKKTVFAAICLFALLLGGCANRENTPLGRGFELIDELEVLINDDEAMKLYNINDVAYETEINALRKINFSKPERVYKVVFDTRELLEMLVGKELSDDFYEIYEDRALPEIFALINSNESTTSIILSSVFNVGNVFECKAVKEDMVYFYIYDGAIVAVSFNDGEDDACAASAKLVLNKKLDTSDISSFEDSLESMFNCSFDVEKVY